MTILKGQFGAALLQPSDFVISAPDTMAGVGFPVATSLAVVQDFPDTITTGWWKVKSQPSVLHQGQRLPGMMMTFRTSPASADPATVTGLTLTFSGGTVEPTSVLAVIYEDTDDDKKWDPLLDTSLATGTVSSLGRSVVSITSEVDHL